MDVDEAESFLAEGEYDYVRFEQTDLHGMSRSKTVPVRHFRRFAEDGVNFLGGLLGLDVRGGVAMGTGYLEERSYADSRIFPDISTLGAVPWAERTARVICEPRWYDSSPLLAHPRHLARGMLDRLNDMGYTVRSGFEYEVYLVDSEDRTPVFGGIQIFWTVRNNFDQDFINWALDSLAEAGVDIITSNAEYGPGQMEINFAPGEGIAAADQAFTFKNGLKELAQQAGYVASFMTKPYQDQSASGAHFHHSLIGSGGENAFWDRGSPDGLSEVARHWIGGQVAHARALAALGAPTVNCPKRFKLYSFAPMNATWGFEDRTAAVRVKGGGERLAHLENRIPCGGSNPYLAMAGVLAAGIDGLERKLGPPHPTETTAYADAQSPHLPATLDEALEAFESDGALKRLLGPEFEQLFLAVKRNEIAAAREAIPAYGTKEWPDTVTDWERANLFEYL